MWSGVTADVTTLIPVIDRLRRCFRTYIAKGLEPPAYKKRAPPPSLPDRFEPYLRERLAAYPP
jgi:hypothetical protein